MDQAEPPQYEQKPFCQDDQCDHNPNFAVICAFIGHFGDKIELELDIEQLKNSIENQEQLDDSLIDLHVKLLRKIRRYLVRDQWERALINFAHEYSYEDALELQQLGYLKTRPSLKLELLKRLLDAQFESDPKFKTAINSCEANELRILPLGRDIKGNSYWQRLDKESNFRIFQEEPLNFKIWKTVSKNPTELKQLIDELEKIKDESFKGEPAQEPYNPLPEIFPEYFEQEVIEEPQNNDKKINGRKLKKGGKRSGRAKKSSSLAVLEEVDETSLNNQDSQKQDRNPNLVNHNVAIGPPKELANPTQLQSVKVNGENELVESQVKLTIENLLSKVVSSFDFLIKPLSRSFIDNHQDLKPEVDDKIALPSRKKAAKQKKARFEVELPRRTSSRIQQLQQKKEEEIKKSIENESIRKVSDAYEIDEDSMNRKVRYNEEKSAKNDRRGKRRKESQRWRQGKGKKKLSWDKDDSDLSSISSPTESNDDELYESEKLDNNDEDEFACEEEDTNNEPVIIKRARTARQIDDLDETGTSIIEEDKPCGRCDKSNDPEWVLLCDICDAGYHTACCIPPLMVVPDGDWFCPPCEHKLLLDKLKEFHSSITETLAEKERERQKRQRLRQNHPAKKAPPKLSTEELVVPEKRTRDNIIGSLNEPIALQNLVEELEGLPSTHREGVYPKSKKKAVKNRKPRGRKRRYSIEDEISRRTKKFSSRLDESESEETDNEFEESSSQSSQESKPRVRKARACVSYRFQEYDELIKSAIQGDSEEVRYEDDDPDEENDDGNEDSETGCNYGRGKDMATIEALAYQQENGLPLSIQTQPLAEGMQLETPNNKKSRKKSRRLNDLDAESEIDSATSDESFQASATEIDEEDDDIMTEIDSEGSSFDEIVQVKSRRSSARKKRSFIVDSDSDYDAPKKKKKKQPKKRSRKKEDYYEDEDEEEESEEYSFDRRSKKNYSKRRANESDETDEEELEAVYSESSLDSKPKQRRARACVSYRFQEYDDLMKSAGQTDSDAEAGDNDKDSDESFKASASEEDDDEKEEVETVVGSDGQSSADELVDIQRSDCCLDVDANHIQSGRNKTDNQALEQADQNLSSCTTGVNKNQTLDLQPKIHESVISKPSYVNPLIQKPNSPPHPPFYDEEEVRPKLDQSRC